MIERGSQAEAVIRPVTPAEWSTLSEGSSAKLRRRLRGDLDIITLKALRKEPQRRYASAEQLAEDIHRHLEGLPVQAAPDSLAYRADKFVQRHKVGVAATLVILIAISAGVVATIREARIAAANQRRAEQRFNDVRKLANSLMFEIHDAIRDLPGSTSARRLLVTRAQEYLDSLSAQSKGDASLQKELAAAYERVGDVLGYPYAANLGDKTGALQNYQKALAIRESLAAAAPEDTALQRDLTNTYFRLAQIFESNGDFPEALAALKKTEPIAQRLAASSNDPELADSFAGGYYFTASIQTHTGDWTSAFENFRHSASIREAAFRANPQSWPIRTHLAADYAGIAQCLAAQHDLPHAIETQSKAVAILGEVVKAHPDNATLSEYLGEGTNRLATYQKDHGQPEVALATYRKAHQIFDNLVTADPKNSLAKSNFGFSNSGVASSLLALGKPTAATKAFQESIAIFEDLSPMTTGNRYPRTGLAEAYYGLGKSYLMLARAKDVKEKQKVEYWKQARSSCQKSLALWDEKQKRGELESGERDVPANVAQCVAASEAQLSSARPK
jgi:eukaryotic-like serine/threonine-protein kinase